MANLSQNPAFIRWLNGSVNLYFQEVADDIPVKLYIDGQELQWISEANLAELRVNGPRIIEQIKDDLRIELDVNLMLSAKLSNNEYTIQDLVGAFFVACNGPIPVYQLDGTNIYLGCLVLRSDTSTPRDIIPWGLVQVSDGPLRVNQTSIESYFVMNL